MLKIDIENWIKFKKLSKIDLKINIANIVLGIIFFIAYFIFIFTWLALPNIEGNGLPVGIVIFLIIAGIDIVLLFINWIFWIINKIKQFKIYNDLSQEEKNNNSNLFIFLILFYFHYFYFFISNLFYTSKRSVFFKWINR